VVAGQRTKHSKAVQEMDHYMELLKIVQTMREQHEEVMGEW
jgi:hypothetical protein